MTENVRLLHSGSMGLAGATLIRIGPKSNIPISSDFDIKAEAIGAKAYTAQINELQFYRFRTARHSKRYRPENSISRKERGLNEQSK